MCVKGMKYSFRFVNSESDEKQSRHVDGLQGSGSACICDLCKATKLIVKENLGTFTISRSISETINVAELMRTNPNKLDVNEIKHLAQGLKSAQLSHIEHSERYVDAPHADIKMGSFFKR